MGEITDDRKIALPNGLLSLLSDIKPVFDQHNRVERYDRASAILDCVPADERLLLYQAATEFGIIDEEYPKNQIVFLFVCVAARFLQREPLDVADAIVSDGSARGWLI